MRTILLVVIGVALVACAPAKKTANSPTPTEKTPESLRFAWSLPAEAEVTQSSEDEEGAVSMRYTLTATLQDDKRIAVYLKDFTFLSFDGVDVASSPELKAASEVMLETIQSSIPPILIAPDGKFSDFADWEGLVELSLGLIKKSRGLSDNDPILAAVRAAMNSPQTKEQLKQKVAEPWMIWVGTWVDFPRDLKGEKTTQVTINGVSDVPVTLENKGAAPGNSSLVRLSYITTLEGDAAKELMLPLLEQLEASAPNPEEARAAFAKMEFKNEARFWVETDPKNLRPSTAGKETLSTVALPGEAPQTKREVTSYTFEWKK